MQIGGMREDATPYVFRDPKQLVGEVRRIAGIGPAYEVLRLTGDSEAMIRVFEAGEVVALKIEDILRDPITETAP